MRATIYVLPGGADREERVTSMSEHSVERFAGEEHTPPPGSPPAPDTLGLAHP